MTTGLITGVNRGLGLAIVCVVAGSGVYAVAVARVDRPRQGLQAWRESSVSTDFRA